MSDLITGQDIFSPLTIVVRMLCAMVAGFMVGYERETHYQPAGLRTHMVLSTGSCLIQILSLYIPLVFMAGNPGADPGRLSAQVISGIGFLGAGAIFRYGFNVRGLTTAASIWTTSGIGLTFGAGFYSLGVVSTVILIVILQVFEKVENKLIEHKDMRVLTVVFHSADLTAMTVIDAIKKFNIDIRQLSITEFVDNRTVEIRINCRVDDDFSIKDLFDKIKSLGSIKTLRIE